MSAPSTQRDLQAKAEALADELTEAGVKRNELSSAINVLFYSTGSWKHRHQRGRGLANRLPTLWLRERGGTVPARLTKVKEVVLRVLDEHPSEAEVRYVLGWTTRMLLVREKLGED